MVECIACSYDVDSYAGEKSTDRFKLTIQVSRWEPDKNLVT